MNLLGPLRTVCIAVSESSSNLFWGRTITVHNCSFVSAGTGKLCIFVHLGLVFIWSCFVSCPLLPLYYVVCAPVHTEGAVIDQFRYIKIQPKTIDLSTRLLGINPTNSVFIPTSLVLRSIVLG